ncbi:MAG: cohesin domain-containing protein [Dehalobacterium sp.]
MKKWLREHLVFWLIFVFYFMVCFAPAVLAEEIARINLPDSPCFTGEKVFLPIEGENIAGMGGFQFTIDYDPSFLERPEISKGEVLQDEGNWQIEMRIASSSLTIIGYQEQGEGLRAGAGTLVKLSFQTKENVPAGTQVSLHFAECTLSNARGEAMSCQSRDGKITSYLGKKCDINKDETVNVLDVVAMVNFSVEKLIPTDLERYTADANNDGVINVLDVVRAINTALGVVEEEPPEGLECRDYYIRNWRWYQNRFLIQIEPKNQEEAPLEAGWYDLAQDCELAGAHIVPGLENSIVNLIYNEEDEKVLDVEVTSQTLIQPGDQWIYDEVQQQYRIGGAWYIIAGDFQGGLPVDFNDDTRYCAFIDRKGEIWKIEQVSTMAPALVEEYSSEDRCLSMKCAGDFDRNYNFTGKNVFVEKDGEYGDLDDIGENDTVYVRQDCHGFDYCLEVCAMKDSGTLQALRWRSPENLEVRINGVWYPLSDRFYMSRDNGMNFDITVSLEDIGDKTVQYMLNKSGQLVYLISDIDAEGNFRYGVVTGIISENPDSHEITKVTVLEKNRSYLYQIDTDTIHLRHPSPVGRSDNELDVDDFIRFSLNENDQIQRLTLLAAWDSASEPGDLLDPYLLYDANGSEEGLGGGNARLESYVDLYNSKFFGLISDGNVANNRIQFGGRWYSVTDETVVFNVYRDHALGNDDVEALVENNTDFLAWAENLSGSQRAYVRYAGSKITHVYLCQGVIGNLDYAVVMDWYTKSGNPWVELDVKGTMEDYELYDGNYRPVEYGLYQYGIYQNKVVLGAGDLIFDPYDFQRGAVGSTVSGVYGSVSEKVYAVVTDVDRANNAVKINNKWYYADVDTVIYDYGEWYEDEDEPEYLSQVKSISKADFIICVLRKNREDIVDLFIIVNNIDH